MQVSCSHCGARYEFDAAAIPAAGYDAQCTTCNGVFFVAPQQEVPAPAPQVAVSCSSCGAVYQFAASEIPPAGYDAQCTQCQQVFFVGPASISPVPPAPDLSQAQTTSTEISVTAPTFGGGGGDDIPTMDASDFASESEVMRNPLLAAEDAAQQQAAEEFATRPMQLPHAQPLAPVLPDLGPFAVPTSPPAPVPSEAATPAPEAMPQDPHDQPTHRGFAPTALHSGTMELELAPVEAPPAEPAMPTMESPALRPTVPLQSAEQDEFSDVMAINAELGEPIEAGPSHLTPEEEAEGISERRSQRWLAVAGALAGVAAVCGLLYLVAPRAFDMTLGRLMGIKRTVDPAAAPFVDKGLAAMLEDTDEAYANATKEFGQALKVDARNPRALALGAVAQVWRGTDLQGLGTELVQTATSEQASVRGLQEVPAAQRTPVLSSKLAELSRQAQQHREAGTDMLETGGRYISDGMEWLLRARRQFPKNELLAEAEALCNAADPDGLPQADKALARSFELRYGAKAAPPAGGPPDAWTPFVQGTLRATDKGATQQVEEFWLSAIKEEPKFQRARWLLARLYVRSGQREAAKHVLDDILTAIPTHAKAKFLLAALAVPGPAAPVVSAPEEPVAHALRGKGKGKAKSKHR